MKKDKIISIRIPVALRSLLFLIAKRKGISVSELIRQYLKEIGR